MSTKKTYESGENGPTQASFSIPTVGDIDRDNFQEKFEQVNEFDYRKIAEYELFMEEKVLVEIPKSTNPNDDPYIPLGVNGVIQPVLRGVQQWIKRKYLEVLVRAQPKTYQTVEEFDHTTGYKTVRLTSTQGEKYPYRVLDDRNPKGMPWLRQILSEQN